MRYQCCCCRQEFDGAQIADDFDKGIRQGFLCPLCGAHIEDPPFGGEIAYSSPQAENHVQLMMALLTVESLLLQVFDLWDAEVLGCNVLLLVLLLDLPLLLYGLIRFPREMLRPALQTRRVKP